MREGTSMQDNGNENQRPNNRRDPISHWWKLIGVEPVMFLYMSAFMLTSVVEEAFFVHKACTVNLGFSEEICNNLTSIDLKEQQKKVQLKVSTFHQYENIASNLVPVLLAFFLGPWSDKVGRKLPLLLGLFGNFVYSTMIVVNACMDSWPVEMILFTASLPCGITGGNLTVFMASFSYLADTTSQEQRTLRTTLLEVAYLLPMPVGVALGSYLYTSVLDRSYAKMFIVNASLLLLALLYTAVFIRWNTSKVESTNNISPQSGTFSCIRDLIDIKHVGRSVKALIRKRNDNRRLYLILTLIAMAFYTFQRGLLIGVPLMERFFGLRDNIIIMIGAMAHLITRIIFASANEPYMFYIGAVIASLGPIVAPVLRSLASKLVPPQDRGKIFALLSVADSTVPLISGVIYTQVYNHSFDVFPQSIFIVTALSQLIVLFITLSLDIMTKRTNITQAKEEDLNLLRNDS